MSEVNDCMISNCTYTCIYDPLSTQGHIIKHDVTCNGNSKLHLWCILTKTFLSQTQDLYRPDFKKYLAVNLWIHKHAAKAKKNQMSTGQSKWAFTKCHSLLFLLLIVHNWPAPPHRLSRPSSHVTPMWSASVVVPWPAAIHLYTQCNEDDDQQWRHGCQRPRGYLVVRVNTLWWWGGGKHCQKKDNSWEIRN